MAFLQARYTFKLLNIWEAATGALLGNRSLHIFNLKVLGKLRRALLRNHSFHISDMKVSRKLRLRLCLVIVLSIYLTQSFEEAATRDW